MSKMHFVHRIGGGNRGESLFAIQAYDTTQQLAMFYVKVLPERKRSLLEALTANQGVVLGEYGEIVASCYGDAPDPAICDVLSQRFGPGINVLWTH